MVEIPAYATATFCPNPGTAAIPITHEGGPVSENQSSILSLQSRSDGGLGSLGAGGAGLGKEPNGPGSGLGTGDGDGTGPGVGRSAAGGGVGVGTGLGVGLGNGVRHGAGPG